MTDDMVLAIVSLVPVFTAIDSAVLVDDLVVRFGELEAVGGVSFAVAPGEVFPRRDEHGTWGARGDHD